MPDKAWKVLERKIGKLLQGERVKRMGDYAQSATDVVLHDLPEIKIDCKLRRSFLHHALFLALPKPGRDRPRGLAVLVTREAGERDPLVTVDVHFFAKLIQARRFKSPEGELPRLDLHLKARNRFKHHALHREIQSRYCNENGGVPVLVTKEHRKKAYLVTVAAAFFAELLSPWGVQNSALGVRVIRSRTPSAGGLDS